MQFILLLFVVCLFPVWQQALRHNAIKSLYND